MIPHTIFRKQVAPAVEKLTEALRGREDHARFCGLVTRQTVHGLVIEWHDSFRYQGGQLLTVPSMEPAEEIVQEFVWALTEWRRAAAALPAQGKPPEKEYRNAERERGGRRLDQTAHRRALARRAAAR